MKIKVYIEHGPIEVANYFIMNIPSDELKRLSKENRNERIEGHIKDEIKERIGFSYKILRSIE